MIPDTTSVPRIHSENGVFIEGIKLVNARLDEKVTTVSFTYGCINKLPIVHLRPHHEEEVNFINLPVYRGDREDVLFNVSLKASSEIMNNDVYILA